LEGLKPSKGLRFLSLLFEQRLFNLLAGQPRCRHARAKFQKTGFQENKITGKEFFNGVTSLKLEPGSSWHGF
jgi:hypothetical protein